MNLVEVDGLKIVSEGKKRGVKFVWADITNAPTVDAIPVEWLRERKHWAAIDGDPWAENIISHLLEAWQKEQEAI